MTQLSENPLPEVAPSGRPLAEMAVWEPVADGVDAGSALADLDRRGMLLLIQVGVAALALAVITGIVSVWT
jgi:hypothetical protein